VTRRGLSAAVAALAIAASVHGAFAASLAATVPRLGSGTVAVTACDANGFTFAHSIDTAGRITSVTVSGIDAACAGGTLRLTLTNGTTSAGSGSTSLPSSGFSGTASVAISPQPLSSGVSLVYAVVEGP
jgi:hypothetical protein